MDKTTDPVLGWAMMLKNATHPDNVPPAIGAYVQEIFNRGRIKAAIIERAFIVGVQLYTGLSSHDKSLHPNDAEAALYNQLAEKMGLQKSGGLLPYRGSSASSGAAPAP